MPLGFLQAILKGAKARVDAGTVSALPEPFRQALALMKRQGALESEMLALETDSDAGRARRDAIQLEMSELFAEQDRSRVVKECARIACILADSSDPALTIDSITEEELAVLVSAGGSA